MGWYDDDYQYVPVSVKKDKAQKELAKLQKKYDVQPILIEGRKIAKTWWGISWCKNLESYADYENRIARGSAYLKNGFVLDLKILAGQISALVYGSALYKVFITIKPLSPEDNAEIVQAVSRRFDSIEHLVSGDFPPELGELFLTQGKGLFPSPAEISFDCDCPDSAYMCKHIAAVLYGVGARLDQDPLLFFKLRKIDVSEFIKKSAEEKMKSLLKNANKITPRVIKDANIEEIFGL